MSEAVVIWKVEDGEREEEEEEGYVCGGGKERILIEMARQEWGRTGGWWTGRMASPSPLFAREEYVRSRRYMGYIRGTWADNINGKYQR